MKRRVIFIFYIMLGWVIISMMSMKAMPPGKCYGQTDDPNMSIPSTVIPIPAIIPDRGADSTVYNDTRGDDRLSALEDEKERVAIPSLSPSSGTFTSSDSVTFSDSVTVSITCTTPGAEIRYTTDSNEPTGSSLLYTLPLTLTDTAVLKAKGFKNGYPSSDTATGTYTRIEKVALPSLSPPSATSPDSTPDSTTLSIPYATSSGASIPYATDGSEPTDAGIYTAGIYTTAAGGLANSAWPCRGHDARHTGQSPYIGAQTNNLKWSYQTGGGVYSSPAIGADGTLYVGGGDGKLYAFNPNGSLKWSYPTMASAFSSPAIGADGTVVYVENGNKLYALNPNGSLSGAIRRRGLSGPHRP